VIVVLIIGIMSAATVPQFMDSVQYFHAEAAAKRIKIDLELARRRAKSTSTSQLVDFDSTTHTYVLPNVPDLKHAGSNYTVDLTRAPYKSSLLLVDFDNTEEVTFDGYGVPDNAGSIEVKAGTYLWTISVEATTGKVTIQ
jgi:type II secretory pathway pseudopilin PulG